MILIADGGSTKCDWAVVNPATAEIVDRFETEGINPYARSQAEIEEVLQREIAPRAARYGIERVYFYGAGATPERIPDLARWIGAATQQAAVEVFSDMVGAARATVGRGSGTVCILGTGSNSCYYADDRIVQATPALGYILGDEGSGTVLGRKLVGDILKGVAPEAIRRDFEMTYHLTQGEIIERVYRRPMANRFLASFAPFLAARMEHPYIYRFVVEAFGEFVRRNLTHYPAGKVYAIGSVAYYFRAAFEAALTAEGLTLGGIERSPMAGLVRFHSAETAAETPAVKAEAAQTAAQTAAEKPEKTFRKITEESSFYDNLEQMEVGTLLRCIHREDHRVATVLDEALPEIEKLVTQLIPRLKQGGRLFYMGAGTSGRLGVLDASEIPPTFGMPPTVVIGLIAGGDRALRNPIEGAEDDRTQGWRDLQAHQITPLDTVVGIAASGTTPYVIGAITEARRFGCLTASVASNPCSPLGEAAEIAIETIVGPEVVTGSSRMKSGSAQKMVCNMITTAAMIGLGRVRGNRMVNMQLSNQKLVDRGTRMIVDELGLPYDTARQLLLIHGSVQQAVEAYRKE